MGQIGEWWGKKWIDFRLDDHRAAHTRMFVFQLVGVFEGEGTARKDKLISELVPSVYNIYTTQPVIMYYHFRTNGRTTACTNNKTQVLYLKALFKSFFYRFP